MQITAAYTRSPLSLNNSTAAAHTQDRGGGGRILSISRHLYSVGVHTHTVNPLGTVPSESLSVETSRFVITSSGSHTWVTHTYILTNPQPPLNWRLLFVWRAFSLEEFPYSTTLASLETHNYLYVYYIQCTGLRLEGINPYECWHPTLWHLKYWKCFVGVCIKGRDSRSYFSWCSPGSLGTPQVCVVHIVQKATSCTQIYTCTYIHTNTPHISHMYVH